MLPPLKLRPYGAISIIIIIIIEQIINIIIFIPQVVKIPEVKN